MDQKQAANRPVSGKIGPQVEAQMTRLLYRSAGFGLFSNFVLAAVLTLGLTDNLSWQTKIAWFAVSTVVTALRYGLNLAFDRCQPNLTTLPRWRIWFVIGTAAAGLV